MVADVWRRALGIVEAIQDLPRDEWSQAIHDRCGEDSETASAALELMDSMLACPAEFLPEVEVGPSPDALLGELPQPLLGVGYRLIEEVGRGNSAVVYRAHQEALDREVAVKVFRQDLTTTPQQIARFRSEAESMARLQHPGIVSVFDHNRTGDLLWFAMEYVEGHDLATELRHQESGGSTGPMYLTPSGQPGAVSAAATLCARIADALQAAHEAAVVHRDVKPHNILLHLDGRPRVADFGIARDEMQAHLTLTGEIAGSPYYMSPEQVRGARDQIDRRTDVYSLGVVLYQVLTRRLPHEGKTTAAVTASILNHDPVGVRRHEPRLPQDIETICAKAISRDATDRYSTCAEFAADLRRFTNLEAIHATRRRWRQRCASWLRRYRRSLAIVGLGAALACLALVYILQASHHAGLDTRLDQVEQSLLVKPTPGAESDHYDTLADARTLVAAVLEELPAQSRTDIAMRGRRILQGIESQGRALLTTAQETLADGAPPVRVLAQNPLTTKPETRNGPASIASSSYPHIVSAIGQLDQAVRLLPDSRTLQETARVAYWHPRITIDCAVPEANVILQRIDWQSGEFHPGELIGVTPIENQPIPPGYYRVVVEAPGVGFAEMCRWLGNYNTLYDFERVTLRSTERVTADMVPIPASEQTFVRTNFTKGVARHHDLWIDRCEVSNEDYAAFLAAFGDAKSLKPAYWSDEHLRKFPRRPVIGASALQARAYAEWRGKRLPTDIEWTGAASGTEQRRYPWGGDKTQLPRAAGLADDDVYQNRSGLPGYAKYSVDVDIKTFDVTPEGVLHLGGNVTEMTGTPTLGFLDGHFFPSISHCRLKGQSWMRKSPPKLYQWGEQQAYQYHTDTSVGFRCAKSRAPFLNKK